MKKADYQVCFGGYVDASHTKERISSKSNESMLCSCPCMYVKRSWLFSLFGSAVQILCSQSPTLELSLTSTKPQSNFCGGIEGRLDASGKERYTHRVHEEIAGADVGWVGTSDLCLARLHYGVWDMGNCQCALLRSWLSVPNKEHVK